MHANTQRFHRWERRQAVAKGAFAAASLASAAAGQQAVEVSELEARDGIQLREQQLVLAVEGRTQEDDSRVAMDRVELGDALQDEGGQLGARRRLKRRVEHCGSREVHRLPVAAVLERIIEAARECLRRATSARMQRGANARSLPPADAAIKPSERPCGSSNPAIDCSSSRLRRRSSLVLSCPSPSALTFAACCAKLIAERSNT